MKIIVSRIAVVEKKYNPDQPRAPKGSPEGGQWVDDASAAGGGVPVVPIPAGGGERNPGEYYHLTSSENAASIAREGFRPSETGELGPGVYLAIDPTYLTAPKFKGADRVVVELAPGTRVLEIPYSPNVIMDVLEGLYGSKDIYERYDAMTRTEKFTDRGQANWDYLHRLIRENGYHGVTVAVEPGSLWKKNTVVFDPKRVIVKRVETWAPLAAKSRRTTVRVVVEKKYNPDQPRAPKGSPEGGQWVDDASAAGGEQSDQEARGRITYTEVYEGYLSFPPGNVETAADPTDLLADYGINKDDLEQAVSLPGMDANINVVRVSGYDWEDSEKKDRLEIRVSFTKAGFKASAGRSRIDLYRNGTAYFNELVMRETGHDAGTQFFRRHLTLLENSGYSQVSLFANISIGRYAWAREGVQYAAGDASNYTGAKFAKWLEKLDVPFEPDWPHIEPPPSGGTQRQYERWAETANNAANAYWRSRFAGKNPNDIATWKHPKGYKVLGSEIVNKDVPKDMELDVGKAYMLDDNGHGSWDGIIKLNPKKARNG